MKAKFRIYWLLLSGITATAFAQQNNSNRFALVIGVQNYVSVPPLRHSINDASDMAAALKLKGFQVESLYDPKSKREIKEAVTRYYNLMKDKSGAVGIIYYAGHGTQYEGENYFIPAGVVLQVPGDMDDQCVKMNTVMSVMNSSSNNLNILLLDACRTNSFPSFSRDIVSGLTKVDAPKGSIVVFATQPGTIASDGTGKNGLFTSKLLKYINEPNLDMAEVFRKVKQDVYAESGNKQLPSVEDNSFGGDFYFDKTDGGQSNNSTAKADAVVYTAQQSYDKAKELYDQKNYSDALPWFQKSADQGLSDSQVYLGYMYENGFGVAQNNAEAVKWYRKAAELGNALGQTDLGWMYENGVGTELNYAEAVKWYRMAANQGDALGQNNLGIMYKGGYGVAKDETEAVRWYRKSADQGNAYGENNLGVMYRDGRGGLPKDDGEAIRWYRKAAVQENADAQGNLGWMYANGRAVEKDETEAVRLYKLAVDQGNANAQTNLGWMYANGHAVTQDYVEAVRLYRLAADQGYAMGQYDLGWMYAKGNGVAKDEAEAVRWYRLAADQGNGNAQTNLGVMYRDGRGVGQDDTEAIKWFRLAADQGHANGQSNLGWMYETGRGVALNIAEAMRWYQQAADQGDQYSLDALTRLKNKK